MNPVAIFVKKIFRIFSVAAIQWCGIAALSTGVFYNDDIRLFCWFLVDDQQKKLRF